MSNGAYPQVVAISPDELKIDFALNAEVRTELTLQSKSNELVAFKIKTTAPKRYAVSPTIGLIPANSTVKINIILHRHAEYPPEDPSGKSLIDKFQVQTMRIGAGTAADTLAQLWTESEQAQKASPTSPKYAQVVIKCKLNVTTPSAPPTPKTAPLPEPPKNSFAPLDSATPGADAKPSPTPGLPATETPAEKSAKAPAKSVAEKVEKAEKVTKDASKSGSEKSDAKLSASSSMSASIPGVVKRTSLDAAKSTDGVAMSVELQRKVQDYDQLLKEVVKLTTENERLDAHAKSLQSKNNELMAQRKALEQQVHEARAAAALSNADSEIRNRVKTPLNSTVSGSESSVEESREAVQSSIQLWQVLVVAILCLIIGRML